MVFAVGTAVSSFIALQHRCTLIVGSPIRSEPGFTRSKNRKKKEIEASLSPVVTLKRHMDSREHMALRIGHLLSQRPEPSLSASSRATNRCESGGASRNSDARRCTLIGASSIRIEPGFASSENRTEKDIEPSPLTDDRHTSLISSAWFRCSGSMTAPRWLRTKAAPPTTNFTTPCWKSFWTGTATIRTTPQKNFDGSHLSSVRHVLDPVGSAWLPGSPYSIAEVGSQTKGP